MPEAQAPQPWDSYTFPPFPRLSWSGILIWGLGQVLFDILGNTTYNGVNVEVIHRFNSRAAVQGRLFLFPVASTSSVARRPPAL